MRISDWSSDVCSSDLAEPVWTDPLSVIVPARHPLLAHVQVPLPEALKFPLVLCHPEAGSGCRHQIQAVLQDTNMPLKLVDEVTSLGVMLTLVGAGYGIGFAIASQVQTLQRPDISRSEEHTSELQSLMRISYAVFCLK